MRWYDRNLSGMRRMMRVSVRSQMVNTRYGETHVLSAGDPHKPTIAFIHGINVNALGWKHQIERLSRDYHVIAPDVIGFSGRSIPVRLPYHGAEYALWLQDVFDAMHVNSAVLVGSSGGGHSVLKYAVHFPQHTAGLVLINPCGVERYPYPTDWSRNKAVMFALGWIGRNLIASRGTARRMVKASASPSVPIDDETVEMAYILLKHFKRYPPPGRLPAHELQSIEAPVLLLMSEHEPYFSPSMVIRRATQHIRHLQTQIVPDAGHDIHNDQADIVADYLRGFMRQVMPSVLTGVEVPLPVSRAKIPV